jgi:pimeloyl-ACP methyl ester carboxylesterase
MSQINLTHHHIRLNGINLHYVKAGQGEPVVLLHGWPQTWYAWRSVIPMLSEKYTVIAPDMRGFGDSSKPQSGYDSQTVAKDIADLMEQLGFTHFHVAGNDWGGPVACALAATYRDRVKSLAVIEAPIPGIEVPSGENPFAKFWHPGFHMVPDLPEALTQGREQIYLTWYFSSPYVYNTSAIDSEAINEYVRAASAPGGMRGGFEYFRAAPQGAMQAYTLAQTPLEIPVLALGGEVSFGDFMLQQAQVYAKDVQGGIIPECGHFPSEERPDYIAKQLLALFKHQSSRFSNG